jgi:uncharacterized protein
MRMTNDRDQAIVRAAVSDGAANLLDFLPSLGTGEVFAFGEGVALPARVKLTELPAHLLPKGDAISGGSSAATTLNQDFLAAVLKRWRSATTAHQPEADDAQAEPRIAEAGSAAPLQPAGEGEQPAPHLRKRPGPEGLDIARAFEGETTRLSHG